MVADGRLASYAGPAGGGLSGGERGQVLSGTDQGAHVLWHTGALAGQVTQVYAADLEEAPQPGLLDDSLDAPASSPVLAVRDVYDREGEGGLLAALGDTGALVGLSQVAEEVVSFASARIRSDAALAPVLAQLDAEEADSVVGIATAACIREALGD